MVLEVNSSKDAIAYLYTGEVCQSTLVAICRLVVFAGLLDCDSQGHTGRLAAHLAMYYYKCWWIHVEWWLVGHIFPLQQMYTSGQQVNITSL